jgi:hypothetical protein
MTMALTGGCQCGAVRFRVEGEPGRASICHCRMCQKAFGGFYGPYVTVTDVTWTRGAPKRFQSSNRVWRGFCEDCGTPLTFELDGRVSDLAIGAFDAPARVAPQVQVRHDDGQPFTDRLADLPCVPLPYSTEGLVSHQHPDRDTESWTPKA